MTDPPFLCNTYVIEIGQSLLHKHEQFVSESKDIKNELEQEVCTSSLKKIFFEGNR